jgi:hypothetical protein
VNPFMLVQLGIGAVDGVNTLIHMFEKRGNGVEKKAMVKAAAKAGLDIALIAAGIGVATDAQNKEIDQILDKLIDAVVGFKNATGQLTTTPHLVPSPQA